MLLPTALHAFVFGMFFNNAWLRYVITGKMLPSMNPVSMAGWMLTYPEIIFNNMMSQASWACYLPPRFDRSSPSLSLHSLGLPPMRSSGASPSRN